MFLAVLIGILTILGGLGEKLQEGGFAGFQDELSNTDFENSTDTLRLVQVLYRHGDRSQIHNYTNDIYEESDWPQGYGQLSREGMRQEYILGTFLRESYVETGFLNSEYTRSELYVRSTSFDRALMSAYCVLSALFPPFQGERDWNSDIEWQPIPVHNVPIEEDYLLVPKYDCPVYSDAKSKSSEQNSTIEQTMNNFSDFYDIVSEHSGEPRTWGGINTVLDPIFCQVTNGFTQPDWVTEDIFEQIVQLRDIYASVGSLPREFAYLKGGLLVGEMLDHMINKSRNDSLTPQKLFMYSAHDSTLIPFLTTLGIFNDQQPPYTACVIVELHEIHPGEFAVQFSYKNETEEEPYILKLPDCDELCPLNEFAEMIKPSIPNDIRKACGLGPENAYTMNMSKNVTTNKPNLATVTVIVLVCLILIMFFVVAILCCLHRNKLANTHDYMPVPVEMSEAS